MLRWNNRYSALLCCILVNKEGWCWEQLLASWKWIIKCILGLQVKLIEYEWKSMAFPLVFWWKKVEYLLLFQHCWGRASDLSTEKWRLQFINLLDRVICNFRAVRHKILNRKAITVKRRGNRRDANGDECYELHVAGHHLADVWIVYAIDCLRLDGFT